MPADRVNPGVSLDPRLLVHRRPGLERAFPFNAPRVHYFGMGRTAIWHGLRALGLSEGDELLVPIYNCGSDIDPLVVAGLKLVYYPVDDELNARPAEIASLITPRTKALYLTHFLGFPQRHVDELAAICTARGIALIEDCAHALLGCYPDGRPLGSLGDIAIFSFRKTLRVGDGAALVLNRPGLPAPTIRLRHPLLTAMPDRWQPGRALAYFALRARGQFSRGSPPRPGPGELGEAAPTGRWFTRGRHDNVGISRWTERHLDGIDPAEIARRRRQNFLAVRDNLPPGLGFTPLFTALPPGTAPLAFPILADQPRRTVADLARHGIAAMRWWTNFHVECPWQVFPHEAHLKTHTVAIAVHQRIEKKTLAKRLRAFARANPAPVNS